MLITRDTRVTPRSTLTLREESDDCAILFDPDSGEAHALSPVAAFCWLRLNGHKSVAELTREVGLEFNDVPENLERDILELVAELLRLNLVVSADPGLG